MKKQIDKEKPMSADAIARMADKGRKVSRFFTNAGTMMNPIQTVTLSDKRDEAATLPERA